ncbi:MAG: tryptophan synthase subunit alpha [Candidatus Thiothrix putei]|uniref:Tryptophan synthase alpha chain n=1 Tax=Candidatus Thiothrix putei TaxID=3080811 RepID=A0AA95HEG6_9GAMM|nr:MAG: tryptophan synthase subunit alpha [Candidatus Thiothrix putei]
MSRIAACFAALKAQGKTALIPYVTAGDPHPSITVPLMHRMVAAGANIIELGVPFSDPMADGPTIQQAHERALLHNTSLLDILGMVAEFRQTDTTTPVVLMGYLNPIEIMGYAEFAKAAEAAGVDGALTVDLPPEEGMGVLPLFRAHGIDPIFLLSPTTPERRIATVAEAGGGFIYYVSLKGVTGASTLDVGQVAEHIAKIRQHTDLPLGVGFGIKDAATAAAVAKTADAVVVGSAVIKQIEATPNDHAAIMDSISDLLASMRTALDA